jgi:iron complex transport system substrate-binding protein
MPSQELFIMSEPRIVSLIASATEIVCALGMEHALVGRSHECDYPPSIRRLPVCTQPKFDVSGSSAEIDRRVRQLHDDERSVYRIDAELLKELSPDVIVTQAQCEVCAVSERAVQAAVATWSNCTRIVTLLPNALSDVWLDIEKVAIALGRETKGRELIKRLQERMATIAVSARRAAARPRVACLEWIDPLIAAGHWMPELIEMAGGTDVFGKSGAHAPPITWDQLRAADPDVVIVTPCGLDISRTWSEMPTLVRLPGWERLSASQTNRVVVADGNQFFNRPGPRLVESLEILAEVLHPTLFHFGHEGAGWRAWSTVLTA